MAAKSRKRGNGSGTIYQLANGRWRWQSSPLGPDEKRVSRTYRTKTEAEQARAEGMTLIRQGTLSAPTKRTVAEQLTLWLDDNQPGWAINTHANYRRAISIHICPEIGHIKLTDVTPEHVLGVYRTIRDARGGQTRCQTILRTVKTALKGAFELAVATRVMAQNPAERVSIKVTRPAEAPITPHWDLQQASTYLQLAPDTPWAKVFTFGLITGLRRGEVLGLRWRNVFLEAEKPKIYIIDNLTVADGKPLLTTLKGHRQKRYLMVAGQALKLLQELRAESDEGEYVFQSAVRTRLSPDNADRALKVLCTQLDLPLITPHGLRHTYVSVQRSLGISLERISKQLGHASALITLQIYSHLFLDDLDDLTLDLLYSAKRKDSGSQNGT